MSDTNSDDFPDSVSIFASHASIGISTSFASAPSSAINARVVLGRDSAVTGHGFDVVAVLEDTNGDAEADAVREGYADQLFPQPAYAPDFAEVDSWVPGNTNSMTVSSGQDSVVATCAGVLNDVLQIRDLNGPVLLGSGAIVAPKAWALVALSTPLKAGHFVEVRSSVALTSSTYAVRSSPHQRGRFIADSSDWTAEERSKARWDVNSDAVDDFVVDVDDIYRIYVGLRDASGVVTASHCLLYPDGLSRLATSASDRLYFEATGLGSPPPPSQGEFWRISSAPGSGLAQRPGDINGDGLSNDALVLTVDPATETTSIHSGIESSGGELSWTTLVVPAGVGNVDGYSVRDFNGDGLLDILLSVTDDDQDLEAACFWSPSGGFALHAGPLLIIEDAESPANGPYTSILNLRAIYPSEETTATRTFVTGLSFGRPYSALNVGGIVAPLDDEWSLASTLMSGNSRYFEEFTGEGHRALDGFAQLCVPVGIPADTVVSAVFVVLDASVGGAPIVVAASNPVTLALN